MASCRHLFITTIISLSSVANGYLYEDEFYQMGSSYLSLLNGLPNEDLERLTPEQRAYCEKRYEKILRDDFIDIRIPIGYFDWTIGKEVFKGGNNYGYSPSIDLGAYAAIRSLLIRSCSGRALFCGFDQENDYSFTKPVAIRGKPYRARVLMYFSSESEFFEKNVGRKAREQDLRSVYMERFFISALQGADAVFYLGHSRNGGGPDFNPPVLMVGENKVNYKGFYKTQRPGYHMMMSALSRGSQPAIMGLMSCDSRDHFLNPLQSKAPGMGVISSTAVITVEEVFTALIGGVDATLRGQCQKGFYKSLRMTARNQTYITMDGMFE